MTQIQLTSKQPKLDPTIPKWHYIPNTLLHLILPIIIKRTTILITAINSGKLQKKESECYRALNISFSGPPAFPGSTFANPPPCFFAYHFLITQARHRASSLHKAISKALSKCGRMLSYTYSLSVFNRITHNTLIYNTKLSTMTFVGL